MGKSLPCQLPLARRVHILVPLTEAGMKNFMHIMIVSA